MPLIYYNFTIFFSLFEKYIIYMNIYVCTVLICIFLIILIRQSEILSHLFHLEIVLPSSLSRCVCVCCVHKRELSFENWT